MSDQNIILDALVYSSIDNVISPTQFRNKNGDYWNRLGGNQGQTTANQLDENTSKDQAYSNFRKFLFGTAETGIEQLFANLLSQSTIKRACCMGYNSNTNDTKNFETSVKIPFVEELATHSGATSDIIANWRKLGYISKTVLIPKSMCPAGYSRPARGNRDSTPCDTFMRAYCENAKEMYNADIIDISGTYSENEYMNITPECGCFADRLKEYGGNPPPLCYSPRCSFSNTVYPDQNSRAQGGCPVNQCVSILNLATTTSLGGQATIKPVNDQSCFSPSTQKEYGLPVVQNPSGLTPPPPPGVTSLPAGPSNGTPPPPGPSGPTPPGPTPPGPTPPGPTPPGPTPPGPTPPSPKGSESEDTIIAGLSNTAFYAIVGGVGGLILIIIIVIIILVVRKNNTSKRRYIPRN